MIGILEENKEVLQQASDFLLQKETITGKEFMDFIAEAEKFKSRQLEGDSPAAQAQE